jgi:hypothetical protein
LGNTQAFSTYAQLATITAAYRIISPDTKLNVTDAFANSHLLHSVSEEGLAQVSDMLEESKAQKYAFRRTLVTFFTWQP